VVSLSALNASNDEFARALELFLTSFVCGTTLATARQIFDETEFRIFPSKFGKLIGLIKKDLLPLEENNLAFVTSGWSLSQGLQIAVITKDRSCRLVGKTQVPKGIENKGAISNVAQVFKVDGI
jgi:hypothetical protein